MGSSIVMVLFSYNIMTTLATVPQTLVFGARPLPFCRSKGREGTRGSSRWYIRIGRICGFTACLTLQNLLHIYVYILACIAYTYIYIFTH